MTTWTDVQTCRSQGARLLHGWWAQARAGRPLPDRIDFDPSEHRALLPNLMVVEAVGAPLRFRYRLVGTKVVENCGHDFTGAYLDALLGPEPAEPWEDLYKSCRERAAPVFGEVTERTIGGASFIYEFGVFPLTTGGTEARQFLAYEDYFNVHLRLAMLPPWPAPKTTDPAERSA